MRKTGDVRRETLDRKHETGDLRMTGDVRKIGNLRKVGYIRQTRDRRCETDVIQDT